MYLEHYKVFVGVDYLVLEARTAADEYAFVDGSPVFKYFYSCRGGVGIAGELPFERELVGCRAVAEEVGVVVVYAGIVKVAYAGVVPTAAAVAPVAGIEAREDFHGRCFVVVAAEAAGEQFLVGVGPWLLSEMSLCIGYVGGAVEHCGMVDCVDLRVVLF